jgi:fucose permease
MESKAKRVKLKKPTIDSNNSNSLNSDFDGKTSYNDYLIAEKPYRFVILIITALLNFANGFGKTNITSISNDFKTYYHMTSLQTYLFSNIYYYMFIIMTIPSIYLIEKKSLKLAVRII